MAQKKRCELGMLLLKLCIPDKKKCNVFFYTETRLSIRSLHKYCPFKINLHLLRRTVEEVLLNFSSFSTQLSNAIYTLKRAKSFEWKHGYFGGHFVSLPQTTFFECQRD